MKTLLKIIALLFASTALAGDSLTLLNVSYDPTRELYQEINTAFSKDWSKKNGKTIAVEQSHGGSGKQARAVIDGLEADVVTLALASDIDALNQHGELVAKNWQERLPDHSCPYTSIIVFLVKKGNPKKIKDWDDVVRPGISVITPNPKTSGGARWNYLAAYGYALQKSNSEAEARKFIEQLFRNVPVLDTGARAATITFTQHHTGDVLLSWENEALLAAGQPGQSQFEIVYPSVSILAEPPVAVVDKVVEKHGTRKEAEEYLHFLYTPEAQEIAAHHFFRPRLDSVATRYQKTFPAIKLFTVEDEMFGGWSKAQKVHFNEGGLFDQISRQRR